MFETPIALFIFNRPSTTERTFAAIAQMRPKYLVVVADGPRNANDEALCAATRRIATNVTWPCELHRLFSDVNLGCKRRVASGLDWVFLRFARALILEDDCVPAPGFFKFCEVLLERYATEERVSMIGGSALFGGNDSSFSYSFSRYPLIWGWASWRRAWQGFDPDMTHWPEDRNGGLLDKLFSDRSERDYWQERFDSTFARQQTWDYQWILHCWRRAGLTALPATNLVTNIGFGPDATHTNLAADSARLSVPSGWLEYPLRHPPEIVRDTKLDARIFREIFKR